MRKQIEVKCLEAFFFSLGFFYLQLVSLSFFSVFYPSFVSFLSFFFCCTMQHEEPHFPVCLCVCGHARVSVLSRVWLFCDPTDCSPPGSSVHGILLARLLEWVAISSFRGTSPPRSPTSISYISCFGSWVLYHYHHPGSCPKVKRKWKSLSCVWQFVIPWTIQSLKFPRPEYWSG